VRSREAIARGPVDCFDGLSAPTRIHDPVSRRVRALAVAVVAGACTGGCATHGSTPMPVLVEWMEVREQWGKNIPLGRVG
jgi:hypothetical protein